MSKKVQIKVEFESRSIRHLAIQCPDCAKWFTPGDVVLNEYPCYDHDICFLTECGCPICGCQFDLSNVEKDESVEFPEFYEQCVKKKVTWE